MSSSGVCHDRIGSGISCGNRADRDGRGSACRACRTGCTGITCRTGRTCRACRTRRTRRACFSRWTSGTGWSGRTRFSRRASGTSWASRTGSPCRTGRSCLPRGSCRTRRARWTGSSCGSRCTGIAARDGKVEYSSTAAARVCDDSVASGSPRSNGADCDGCRSSCACSTGGTGSARRARRSCGTRRAVYLCTTLDFPLC